MIIVVDDDRIDFSEFFGDRSVSVSTQPCMRATGHATIRGRRICVVGDERAVFVLANYTAPGFPVPGKGRITITGLSEDQRAHFIRLDSEVIVKGSTFRSLFQPDVPASNPKGEPDPNLALPSEGFGRFVTSQELVSVNFN